MLVVADGRIMLSREDITCQMRYGISHLVTKCCKMAEECNECLTIGLMKS